MLLPFEGIAPVVAEESSMPSATSNFVNLYIDEIKILDKVGDVTGQGEFRLYVMAADTTGKSSGMFCPGSKSLKVSKGDIVKAPCLLSVSFDDSKVSDGVYITIIAVDEDKSSLPTDLSYEAASAGLAEGLGWVAKKAAPKLGIKVLEKSTPFTFAVSVLYSVLSSKIKDWIQQADIIGSQGIYLSRKDNWAEDKTNTITSSDGGIRITYTIVHTSSSSPNPKASVLGSTTSSSNQTTSTQKYWCDELKYVKLKVGDHAKVVWPNKVNLRTAPIVPQEYYENSIAKLDNGETLTVIGGPACAHEGTWWQVRIKNGLIGWMRERISDGYLIGK
jgi:hypothetical protein